MTNWLTAFSGVLATMGVVALAARGFVAFVSWRESFRHRLIGGEPCSGEVG